MRTFLIEQADAAGGVAEQHQVLAEQPHPQRRAVGLGDLSGKRRGNPITAHQRAHGGVGTDAREEFVFVLREHGPTSIDD